MKPWLEASELVRRLRNAKSALGGLDRLQLYEDEVTWRLQLARDSLTLMIADAVRMEETWWREATE